MGQRPSFSHLTGYPEAVASAQDFAPYGCTERISLDSRSTKVKGSESSYIFEGKAGRGICILENILEHGSARDPLYSQRYSRIWCKGQRGGSPAEKNLRAGALRSQFSLVHGGCQRQLFRRFAVPHLSMNQRPFC